LIAPRRSRSNVAWTSSWRPPASPATKSKGLARLRWDRNADADAYVIVRDGKEIGGPLRIEGSQKEWTDKAPLNRKD
jgi:hypothetical protein